MAYNGKTLMNAARAVVSTYHQSMKFSMSQGVGCVRGDQHVSRKCYVDNIQVQRVGPVMMLGGGLPTEDKEKMIACLRDNLDVFAWTPNDIPGISLTISQHRLGVLLGSKPIK
ncbi:reverse transcriptase [Abeliophyllum distichum]|uniref:Reverse transcriptase n=1 Tax=Abeliophyllum distichum TaxID=126358 RepID=A0ABD1URU6_9LAMI